MGEANVALTVNPAASVEIVHADAPAKRVAVDLAGSLDAEHVAEQTNKNSLAAREILPVRGDLKRVLGPIACAVGPRPGHWSGSAVKREQRFAAGAGRAPLRAVPSYTALFDAQGMVRSINHAWKQFHDDVSERRATNFGNGQYYPLLCEAITGVAKQDALRAARKIRTVLARSASEFAFEYVCNSAMKVAGSA